MNSKILENISLKPYNTFGIDVQAKYFVDIRTVEQLPEVLAFAQERDLQIFILGGGSNVLFTQNFNGLVIKNSLKGIKILNEDASHCYIQVASGENWHDFVLFTIQNNYSGVENLSLIPGNCGAAPMQNIGAYGVEIKQVIHTVQTIHVKTGEPKTFTNAECHFGYRDSIFKQTAKGMYIITSIVVKLNKHHHFNIEYGAIRDELKKMGVTELSLQAVSDAVCSIRSSKLPNPKVLGNAGSFFKNPVITQQQYTALLNTFPDMPGHESGDGVKIPAGWLIEKAGWKGKKMGSCGVHEKQALVIVNYGNSTGSEIYDLSERILQDITQKFNIVLEREVNIL